MRCPTLLAGLLLLNHPNLLVESRPNIIIMQPDDFEFMEQWLPPAHFQANRAPSANLPNLERLRTNGLQMMRAYTASAMCGTSRYSTITGRYPSRSATSRSRQDGAAVSSVTIPTTKLNDVSGYGLDCSKENLAAVFQANGYRTGVMGKWHLHRLDDPYSYDSVSENIRQCGFDSATSIYPENLNGQWTFGAFSHNMEHMTAKAIEFIDDSVEREQEFFLYFNPTAPHGSGSVLEALTTFSCRDTPEGQLDTEPVVLGMTQSVGCEAYRQTVIDRASDTSNSALGSVWVDDAVGALMQHLGSIGQLNNTFFLFQLDHGQEGKSTVFEPGVRLAQFIHYPDGILPGRFDGLVSTIDIGPTVLDYAGISGSDPRGVYSMDGLSWKTAVETQDTAWNDRCIIAELETDRAVICGCDKYISLDGQNSNSGTLRRAIRFDLVTSSSLVGLCSENGQYIISPESSSEGSAVSNPVVTEKLQQVLNCHLEMTRPSSSQDYRVCDDQILRTVDPPTATPTTTLPVELTLAPSVRPTKGPTATPTLTPTVSPTTSPLESRPLPTSSPSETFSRNQTLPPSSVSLPTSSPATSATPVPTINTTSSPTWAPVHRSLTPVPSPLLTSSPVETQVTLPANKTTTTFPTLVPAEQALDTEELSFAPTSMPQGNIESSVHRCTRWTAMICWGSCLASFILSTTSAW